MKHYASKSRYFDKLGSKDHKTELGLISLKWCTIAFVVNPTSVVQDLSQFFHYTFNKIGFDSMSQET